VQRALTSSVVHLVLVLGIFTATLFLALTKPRGIHESVWTLCGAAAMMASGAVHAPDLRAIAGASRSAILFLVALLMLSTLVDKSGLFEWAALHAAQRSRGSGHVLFRNVFVLGAIVTATLSLDTTAVLLTPVVLSFVRRLEVDARPYVIACAFVANAGSLALPVSNLTNLILCAAFHLSFGAYVAHMVPVQAGVLVVSYALLHRHFAPALGPFDASRVAVDPLGAIPHRGYFVTTVAVLVAALAGYVVAPLIGVEPYAVAFVAVLVLAAAGVFARRVRLGTAREVSWGVVPFVVGLFVVVQGLESLGLASAVAHVVASTGGGTIGRAIAMTAVTATASNVVNNLPAALVARSAIDTLGGGPSLVYAALVGTNVGPNVVPFGSLATVLVLALARERGVRVPAAAFVRAGLWTTPLVCLLASVAVALTVR
jgi:arsenical pump membrane protein